MKIKPTTPPPSSPQAPPPSVTRATLLSTLPTPPLRTSTLCTRRLFTRTHFLPGQILNAPLHASNVDTKIRAPFVTSTVCGPVFSKRRYFVVLWKYFDRVVCLPVFSRGMPHRETEYVGVTGVGDLWDGIALGDENTAEGHTEGKRDKGRKGVDGGGGKKVLYVEAAQGWGGKIWRSYIDLAFPVGLDIKEDITHTCGFLDRESYVKLVRLFREGERIALEESLSCEEFRDMDLTGLGVGDDGGELALSSKDAEVPSLDEADGKVKVKEKKVVSEKSEEKKKVIEKRRTEKKRELEKRRMEKAARKKEKRKAAKETTKKEKRKTTKQITRREMSGSGKGRNSKKSGKEAIGLPKKSGISKIRVMPTRKAKARVDYVKGTE